MMGVRFPLNMWIGFWVALLSLLNVYLSLFSPGIPEGTHLA